jgi:hypothetical protein
VSTSASPARPGPQSLVGAELAGTTAAWHEHRGRRTAGALHLWLTLGSGGVLRIGPLGNGILSYAALEPYPSRALDEHTTIVVEDGSPDELAQRVGQRIERVTGLTHAIFGSDVGLVLHFADGAVALVNVEDELVFGPWPSADWAAARVAEVA